MLYHIVSLLFCWSLRFLSFWCLFIYSVYSKSHIFMTHWSIWTEAPTKNPPTGGGLQLLLHFHWRCRHGSLILVVAVHVAPIPLRTAGLWRRHGEIRQSQRREEVHVLFRWYDTWQRLWIWDLLKASKLTNNRIGTKKTIKHIIFSKSKVEVMLDSGSFGNIKICWYSAVKQLESPHWGAQLSEIGSVWSWVWSTNHIWS